MSKLMISLAMAACILAACSQEHEIRLTISARQENTRTVLDGQSVSFVSGDCLSVFDGGSMRKFTTSEVYDDGSADFTGSVSSPTDSYIAVYPYREDCTKYGDDLYITIPADQTAVAGSFDPAAAISVGCTENIFGNTHSLKLANVCSLLKFSVPEGSSYAAAILLQGSTEYLTGDFFCTTDSEPVLSPGGENGSLSVSLKGNITGGNWYYIAVNPIVLAGGFSLYLFDSLADLDEFRYSTLKSTGTTVTLSRNGILNLGIIGAEPGASFQPMDGETVFEW